MSINSQSGNPPIQSANAEIPPYYRAVLESVLVSFDSNGSNGSNGLTIIDDQDILLSSLEGQLAVLQSMAVNFSTRDILEINAGEFIGYVDALQRQVSVIKAVHEGIASQLCDLRKETNQSQG